MTLKTGVLKYKLQLEDGERLGYLDDPPPLPEGMLQNPIIIYLYSAIDAFFRGRASVFVDTNTFIYYDRSNRNRRVAPDLYVALGVDADAIRGRNGYLIWEVGKPPDFAIEVASSSTAQNDLTAKRELYARIGISEYWRFDPSGGDLYGVPLTGEILVAGEYRSLVTHTGSDGELWAHSPALDLAFHWRSDRLQVLDPSENKIFRSYIELEEALVESDETLAESNEALRASEAENRALREQLHRLSREG